MTDDGDEGHRPRHLAPSSRRGSPVARAASALRLPEGRRAHDRRTGDRRADDRRADERAVEREVDPPVGAETRRSGWVLPAVLALVALVASVTAARLDGDPVGRAVGAEAAATPVLSARRTPELVAAPVADRRLRADLDAWLASSPPDSCLVVETAGRRSFAHREDEPVTGASTHKLLTATGLLLALGPDERLATRAVASAAPEDGTISGDLHLVGGGDAMLATTEWRDHFTRQPRPVNDIDQLAQSIADSGVTRIEGSVIGDGGRYDDETYHPAWPRRFFDQDSVGPISALLVNDGFAAFPPSGEGDAATVPADDPAADAARVLTSSLEALGVEVGGEPRSGEAPADAVEVAALESPPARDIVAEMLAESDNETAEMALKEMGVREAGEGSWAAGSAALTSLLADAGVDLDGVDIVDGSGLSIDNRLTCTALVDVLTRPETGPVVRDGLAVAGQTGTLADRWGGTEVEGRLRAKTGTLRNVTSLAGEVDAADGGRLEFAYVANVEDPNVIVPADVDQDGLARILAEYPRGVDMASLGPAEPPAG